MSYKPEKGFKSIPTAARVQESPQNNPEANKQVLANFKDLNEEELRAVTGGVDPKIVVGGIAAGIVGTGAIVGGTTYALTHKDHGGIGTGGADDGVDG